MAKKAEKNAKKASAATKKPPQLIQMVAYKFDINDVDHTFYALNKKTGSIDVNEIMTPFDVENVINYLFFYKYLQ